MPVYREKVAVSDGSGEEMIMGIAGGVVVREGEGTGGGGVDVANS